MARSKAFSKLFDVHPPWEKVMPVGWLLEETVFDTYHDELVAAIARN